MMSFLICGLRFSHSPKASSPMLATVFGMLMIVSELHRANAHSPMLVTLSGMLMLVSDLHPENAESPMLVTLSGMLMLVRDLHPENADFPMLVTPSGMLMLVREWHSEKAFCPILFTLLGMLYVLLPPIYAIMIVLSSLNKVLFSIKKWISSHLDNAVWDIDAGQRFAFDKRRLSNACHAVRYVDASQ